MGHETPVRLGVVVASVSVPWDVLTTYAVSTTSVGASPADDTKPAVRTDVPRSTVSGALHEEPFQRTASPLRSTATHWLGEAQDTDDTVWPASRTAIGLDHVVPFHETACPVFGSTPMQNDWPAHDTEPRTT